MKSAIEQARDVNKEFKEKLESGDAFKEALSVHGEIEELVRDARRWRALMASERIRIMGSANIVYATDEEGNPAPRVRDPKENWVHFGLEVWDRHDAPHPCKEYPQEMDRAVLTMYADYMIETNLKKDLL